MHSCEVDTLARKIWDYLLMNHRLAKSDAIVVLGSHDTRVAERGAELFLQGWAPLLVYSGGLGNLTRSMWTRPEAEIFADIAVKLGVPREKILVEPRSTNTGENVRFSRQLLAERKLTPRSVIAVQKPYMERRTFATFKQFWPEPDLRVTSPQLSFDDYPRGDITQDDVIHIMVGDLQRIRVYPAKGFQIAQEIPPEVWTAFERLVALGYTRHLVSAH
jgi:uncharacterized SAM-binding protein YcdF (DUF218 family)